MPWPRLEKAIGIRFANQALLEEALTHKSYAMEHSSERFNERLEFLGDSVLATVVAEYLYLRYPKDDEGKLSKMKSLLVAKPSLVVWAKELKLGQYVRLSQGEEHTGGRERASLLANTLEALLGAIYLQSGYDAARQFILKWLRKKRRFVETDHKSRLQELIQRREKTPPEYRLLREVGPDHDKTFEIEVRVHRQRLGRGIGKSKKEAEQSAARDALRQPIQKE
ncbi:MAG: ribonuclease III [Elusimicrobia bacterium]|nr:ribonuclease III [Elusimicrobiota bacterium]